MAWQISMAFMISASVARRSAGAGFEGTAELEAGVGPGVDVARRDRQAELGQEAALRPLEARPVDVAVERLLEDALVDLDGIHAAGLRALALPLEVVAERPVVRVVARRGEAIAAD